MNSMTTRKTAIMIDGGYYRKRATALWGRNHPKERASEMIRYCHLHIDVPDEPRDLYRIFYYDCPPLSKKMLHPLSGKTIDTALTTNSKWSSDFHKALISESKVAMRMGELATSQAKYILKPNIVEELIQKRRSVDELVEEDFFIDSKQKGVDLRIGLDAASLAYGRYANQIILIAGDSDFVPVAKMVRRYGIEIILDPLSNHVKPSLIEHVDSIQSHVESISRDT